MLAALPWGTVELRWSGWSPGEGRLGGWVSAAGRWAPRRSGTEILAGGWTPGPDRTSALRWKGRNENEPCYETLCAGCRVGNWGLRPWADLPFTIDRTWSMHEHTSQQCAWQMGHQQAKDRFSRRSPLTCRWQCVARRALLPGTRGSPHNKTWEEKISFLSEMPPCISCICCLSRTPASRLSLCTYLARFPAFIAPQAPTVGAEECVCLTHLLCHFLFFRMGARRWSGECGPRWGMQADCHHTQRSGLAFQSESKAPVSFSLSVCPSGF